MQQNVDWRHIVGAVILAIALIFGGWKLLAAGPEKPNAPAPAGPNASMQDAPEIRPPGAGKGAAAGLPTAQ